MTLVGGVLGDVKPLSRKEGVGGFLDQYNHHILNPISITD